MSKMNVHRCPPQLRCVCCVSTLALSNIFLAVRPDAKMLCNWATALPSAPPPP